MSQRSIPSDIEIARRAPLRPIQEIAAKLGIPESAVEPYGKQKAKISLDEIRDIPQKKRRETDSRYRDFPDARRRRQNDRQRRPLRRAERP